MKTTLTVRQGVDPVSAAVLRAVQAAAEEGGFDWFVLGATARDLLLHHVYGMEVERATRDMDFAIAVEDWAQFNRIRELLVTRYHFQDDDGRRHRLLFNHPDVGVPFPVDLLPFGGVEEGQHIKFPPEMAEVMNVAGYREVHEAAIEVIVAEGVQVRVASLPGLMLLKAFAWLDRRDRGNKDAIDMRSLLLAYESAENLDRLYEPAQMDLLEAHDFDPKCAAAALLGRNVRELAEPTTRQNLQRLLFDVPGMVDDLVIDSVRTGKGGATENRIKEAERLFAAFTYGLQQKVSD
jgi:predicted nucleotidyltransferase